MKCIFVKGFALGDIGTDLTLAVIFVIALVISMVGLKTVQKQGKN